MLRDKVQDSGFSFLPPLANLQELNFPLSV